MEKEPQIGRNSESVKLSQIVPPEILANSKFQRMVAAAEQMDFPTEVRFALLTHRLWYEVGSVEKTAQILQMTEDEVRTRRDLVEDSYEDQIELYDKILKCKDLGKHENIDSEVKELRQAGLGNNAIAEALRQPIKRVNQVAHRLIQNGEIERIRSTGPKNRRKIHI